MKLISFTVYTKSFNYIYLPSIFPGILGTLLDIGTNKAGYYLRTKTTRLILPIADTLIQQHHPHVKGQDKSGLFN